MHDTTSIDRRIDLMKTQQAEAASALADIDLQFKELAKQVDRLAQITAAARAPAPWVIN
jgi:hypothetical protein